MQLRAVTLACCCLAVAAVAHRISCRTCTFYTNLASYNDTSCVTGTSVRVLCPEQFACKTDEPSSILDLLTEPVLDIVTMAHDARGKFVHASRGCSRPKRQEQRRQQMPLLYTARTGMHTARTGMYTARTAMYCRRNGCNSNWRGDSSRAPAAAAAAAAAADGQLLCWTGLGRHIDGFKLRPCEPKLLRLADRSPGQQLTCVLAQVTRHFGAGGSSDSGSSDSGSSVAYIGNCALLAGSVFGQRYPIFEYERVCHSSDCNVGGTTGRIDAVFRAATAAAAASAPGALTLAAAAAAVAAARSL